MHSYLKRLVKQIFPMQILPLSPVKILYEKWIKASLKMVLFLFLS